MGLLNFIICVNENRIIAPQIARAIFPGVVKKQSVKPVLVEEIQQRDISYYKKHHSDCLAPWSLHHGLQFRLYDAHIGEFLGDGGQRVFHGAVRLALNEDVAPLMKYPVWDFHFKLLMALVVLALISLVS